MTLSQLIRHLDRAGVGYLVEAVVKKSRMMDAAELFFTAKLYLHDKTLPLEARSPGELWAACRAELGEAPRVLPLKLVDTHRLARRERA